MGSSARMCTVLPADHVFARRSRRRCTLKAMVGDDVAPTEIDDSLVIPEPRVITSPFTLRVFGIASGMLGLFSFLFSRLERWSLLDAFYFTASTMTCVGYGDLRAQCMVSRILCAIAQLFGAGFLAGLVGATLSEWYRENEKKKPSGRGADGIDISTACRRRRPRLAFFHYRAHITANSAVASLLSAPLASQPDRSVRGAAGRRRLRLQGN